MVYGRWGVARTWSARPSVGECDHTTIYSAQAATTLGLFQWREHTDQRAYVSVPLVVLGLYEAPVRIDGVIRCLTSLARSAARAPVCQRRLALCCSFEYSCLQVYSLEGLLRSWPFVVLVLLRRQTLRIQCPVKIVVAYIPTTCCRP